MAARDFRPDRRTLLMAGAAALLARPSLAIGAPATAMLEGSAFATSWRIVLPAGVDGRSLRPAVEAELAAIDRDMSPWCEGSAISRFNRASAGTRELPAALIRVALAALDLASATAGAFDPTVGPLVARYGFGPIHDGRAGLWPSLSVGDGFLTKAETGVTLDLCGIAKGFALDRVADVLSAAGQSAFLIDIGGELLARGHHPSGRLWQAAVEDPRDGAAGPAAMIRLDNMAVATSGTRWNIYVLGGRTISHIIDPVTGEPVGGALASVSVLAPTAMAADGWATALMAAGPENGVLLARRNGVAALFVSVTGNRLQQVTTGGFQDRMLG